MDFEHINAKITRSFFPGSFIFLAWLIEASLSSMTSLTWIHATVRSCLKGIEASLVRLNREEVDHLLSFTCIDQDLHRGHIDALNRHIGATWVLPVATGASQRNQKMDGFSIAASVIAVIPLAGLCLKLSKNGLGLWIQFVRPNYNYDSSFNFSEEPPLT